MKPSAAAPARTLVPLSSPSLHLPGDGPFTSISSEAVIEQREERQPTASEEGGYQGFKYHGTYRVQLGISTMMYHET